MSAPEATAEARALKDRVHVQPRQQQEQRDQREGRRAKQRLLTVLAPNEPGHPLASNLGGRD
jgi:hypothetical protein